MNLYDIIESVRTNLDYYYDKTLELYFKKSQKSILLVKINCDIEYSYVSIEDLDKIPEETRVNVIKEFKMDNRVHCVFILEDGSFYISLESKNPIDGRIIEDIESLRTDLDLNSCSGLEATSDISGDTSFIIKRKYQRTKYMDNIKKTKIPKNFKNCFFFETRDKNRIIKAVIKREISFMEWIEMKLDSFSEALLKDRQIMNIFTNMIKENPDKYILVTISSFDSKSCTEYFCMDKKEILSYLNIDGIDLELYDDKYAMIVTHRIKELSDIAAKIKYIKFITPIINPFTHNSEHDESSFCTSCSMKMEILKDRSNISEFSQCACCDKIEMINQVVYCPRCLIYYLLK